MLPTDTGFSNEGIHLRYSDGRDKKIVWADIFWIEFPKSSLEAIPKTIPAKCIIHYKNGKQEYMVGILGEPAKEINRRFEEYKKLPGVLEELKKLKVHPPELLVEIGMYIFFISFFTFMEFFLYIMFQGAIVVLIPVGILLILTAIICMFLSKSIKKLRPYNT